MEVARSQYADIPAVARAPSCGDCGRCELVCPQNLPVRRLVREAHAALA
jgi:predicted aldo/keto reductase-like oxidoreductase